MRTARIRFRSVLPVALLAGLLLIATACSDVSSAKAPDNHAATQPVTAPVTVPTSDPAGTPDATDNGTPDPADSTPPADATPGSDQAGSSDPFCKKLELDKAAFEQMGDSSSAADDTPAEIQAAGQELQKLADEAPSELKAPFEQAAKLLPKVDTDNPDEGDAEQFAAAMQTLAAWTVQHCGSDLITG